MAKEVEDAHIDVGNHPVFRNRDHRPAGKRQNTSDQRRQQEHALVGTIGNDNFFQNKFEQVCKRLEQTPGPNDVRPRRICTAAQILRSAKSR